MKHPVVAWNAPECSSKSEFHLRKSQEGRWKRMKEKRHGEEKEESGKKNEREREREKTIALRCLNRP